VARDDASIMESVKRGDLVAFDLLVERYRLPLLRVAHSKLGDADRAEDVVQEAFLAVYASRQTYNPDFAFRTWLWTILLNLCRRQLKRKSRRPRQVSESQLRPRSSGGSFPEPLEKETGLTALLKVERREQLMSYLQQLPEPQADALRLRFFGELKYSEIAEAMNSSESGAKRRVKTGLLNLAEMIRQDETFDETRTTPSNGTRQQGEPL